jgi:predicted flap endonuclease-1-like 5' DNA nuclease
VEEKAEVVAGAKTKTGKKEAGVDDLRIIEGIGPKIAEILQAAGISTYAALAVKTADEIREILLEQGSRYKMFDPETWPAQAKLAAAGKMDELQALKDTLHGGRK